MKKLRIIIQAGLLACVAMATLCSQQPAPSSTAEIVLDVRELFSLDNYVKAVKVLEGATAAHPDDLTLLSLLGTAYLYSATRGDTYKNVGKARETMEKVIDLGGEAVLLVSRAKPQSRLNRGNSILLTTPGELRISKDSLSFVPTRSDAEPTGQVPKAELKECGPNHSYGKDSNSFHIKTSSQTLDLRPLHFSKDEAELACALSAKYLELKIVK